MALDLENPEVKAEVDRLREEARAEAEATFTEKYSGLEKNHESLLAEKKAVSAKAKEAQEKLERWDAVTKGRDIDDVETTFLNIENADYKSLLGQEKFDEAYEMRAKADRKAFTKQLEEKDKESKELEGKLSALDEQLMVLQLDNVGVEKFLSSKGNKEAVWAMKSQLRAEAKRGEDGNFFFPDQFGNPRKDSKGNELTIDTWIDEHLKVTSSFLFTGMEGSGASGSKGASAGSNKKRSEMSPEAAGKFIQEHGQEAYLALSA